MNEKIVNKKNLIWKYNFAFILIFLGIIFSYLKLGTEFLGFSSVGLWLIYVGFIMLIVVTLRLIYNKKRIVDERMQFVSTKAARITFIGIIMFSFIIMIIDGIKSIDIAYSYFMSYLICGIVLLYLVSYKILLRFN
jgi:uncharacterized membrane protein